MLSIPLRIYIMNQLHSKVLINLKSPTRFIYDQLYTGIGFYKRMVIGPLMQMKPKTDGPHLLKKK